MYVEAGVRLRQTRAAAWIQPCARLLPAALLPQVVALAGRCGERLVLGEASVSTAGAGDLDVANGIAREMVFRCGFSKRLGPVALMDNEEVFLGGGEGCVRSRVFVWRGVCTGLTI